MTWAWALTMVECNCCLGLEQAPDGLEQTPDDLEQTPDDWNKHLKATVLSDFPEIVARPVRPGRQKAQNQGGRTMLDLSSDAAPLYSGSAPSGAVLDVRSKEEASRKFRLACRMLRNAGILDTPLPPQKRSESLLDWMARAGLAASPQAAAEALLAARGLTPLRDELLAEPCLSI